jgi:hypothetical protein
MSRMEESLLEWIFEAGTPIRRAVFCTYRFDPDFFTEIIYPELRRRRCGRTLVLMDAEQYKSLAVSDDLGASGRVVLERYDAGKMFHPKVFVVAGNGRARCVLGSANLTRDGLEKNYELFSRFKESDCGFQHLIEWLNLLAGHSALSVSAQTILRETIAEMRASQLGFPDHTPAPLVWNGYQGKVLWKQILESKKNPNIKKAVVLSPYFEAPEQFDQGLLAGLLDRGAKVELYVSRDQSQSKIPREEITTLVKQYPRNLKLFSLSTQGHLLHAKLIAVMDTKKAWLLTGSANFTAAALKGKNVELCLLNEMPRTDAEHYLELLLTDSRTISSEDLPEPTIETTIEPGGEISGFISSAILSPQQDSLSILLKLPIRELVKDPSCLQIVIGGVVIAIENSMVVSEATLQIKPASRYLKTEDQSWQLGCVELRTVDGSVKDWRLIEIAEGEELEGPGETAQEPTDIESFVARLLNPRSSIHVFDHPFSQFQSPQDTSPYATNFGDVEGELDRIFRVSAHLDAHFSWLMTDPYTIYRWRSDWIRFYKIFSVNQENWGAVKQAFLSARLLNRLESCLGVNKEHSKQWLEEDGEMRNTIIDLYKIASISPELKTPFLSHCLSVGQV